jgi:hypothetical protein
MNKQSIKLAFNEKSKKNDKFESKYDKNHRYRRLSF